MTLRHVLTYEYMFIHKQSAFTGSKLFRKSRQNPFLFRGQTTADTNYSPELYRYA